MKTKHTDNTVEAKSGDYSLVINKHFQATVFAAHCVKSIEKKSFAYSENRFTFAEQKKLGKVSKIGKNNLGKMSKTNINYIGKM